MSATSADARETYTKLANKLKEHAALSGISGLLGWDEMVQLPPKANQCRSTQKELLAGIIHDRAVDPELGNLLSILQQAQTKGFNEYELATIREAAKDYKKATSIPKSVAQAEAELESRGYQHWVVARQNNDFSAFAPILEEWVALRKQRASLIDPNKKPYDVLLDEYEKGMTSERIDAIFSTVKQHVVPLLARVRAEGTAPDNIWLVNGDFNIDKQDDLCRKIAVELGFDLEAGRLDRSVHPFTGGAHPTDVRMTTRFKKEDITEGLTGAIHETGHALYEQGRNLDHDGLPVNQALSMGVHESQSLFWERMVALSPAFAAYLLPLLKENFPDAIPASTTPQDLYAAMNVVKDPSMIRVESDELTYVLHIILRYELEKGLIEESFKVQDLPQLWNAKMQEYLGCIPETDAQGVLQDVHWSAGLAGYFPTYSLGAMYACQIYAAAKEAMSASVVEENIKKGNFKPIKEWLNEKIHKLGSLPASGDELMVMVTGKPLDPQIFLDYLTDKYTQLYKLE
jgi:carboxypeptidase Taq